MTGNPEQSENNKRIQLVVIFVIILTVTIYYFMVFIVPFVQSKILSITASSRALAEIQQKTPRDTASLAAELDRCQARSDSAGKLRNRSAKAKMCLVPTPQPPPKASICERKVNSITHKHVESFHQRREDGQSSSVASTPQAGKADIKKVRRPLQTTVQTKMTPLETKVTSRGVLESDRTSILAEQDREYELSVEEDLKKRKQALAPPNPTTQCRQPVDLEPEPAGGSDIISIVFRFHGYQNMNEDPGMSAGATARSGSKSEEELGRHAPIRIRRNFGAKASIESLFIFVESCAVCPRYYNVFSGFPKRRISRRNLSDTISEQGIGSNCVVDIEIGTPEEGVNNF